MDHCLLILRTEKPSLHSLGSEEQECCILCPPTAFRLLPSLSPPSSAHRLAEAMQRLGAENEQLKRENERLARVIDSGDWSRQRVQELLEAGQVLQAERDALQKLLGAAAAGGPAAALSSGCGGGSSGYGGAELLGQQAPPLGDATNSPEVTPAAARSPSLAGSGDYEGGVLQRYHVSTAGIQPGGAAGGGSAISADWGSIAGSGRQGINSSRPTSPAARNKLLVGGEAHPAGLRQSCASATVPIRAAFLTLNSAPQGSAVYLLTANHAQPSLPCHHSIPFRCRPPGQERLLVQCHGTRPEAGPGDQRRAGAGYRSGGAVRG